LRWRCLRAPRNGRKTTLSWPRRRNKVS
jgi:hypothetical protein